MLNPKHASRRKVYGKKPGKAYRRLGKAIQGQENRMSAITEGRRLPNISSNRAYVRAANKLTVLQRRHQIARRRRLSK